MTRTNCRSCGASIVWTITDRGKRMPVDADPHPEGTIEVIAHAAEPNLYRSRVLDPYALDIARENRTPVHRSHFATCPQAAGWRRPRTDTHREVQR